jgi:hypothetical protein
MGVDESGAHERRQGEGRRRRVATRRGDQVGAGDVGPEQLRQSVGRRGQQVGLRMGLAVPRGVQRRIAEAEVGGEVDDPLDRAGVAQRRHERLGSAVRQRQEQQIQAGQFVRRRGRRRRRRERQVRVGGRQARVQVGHPCTGLRLAGGKADVERRMRGTQPQQFRAREPGRADDPDSEHRKIIQKSA